MSIDSKIYHFYSHTRPGGGPPGYLHNINNLDSEKISVIVEHKSTTRTAISNSDSSWLSELMLLIRDISYIFRTDNPESLTSIEGGKIIFHSVTHASRYINAFGKKRRNEIYYMSHSPVPTSIEWSRVMRSPLLRFLRRKVIEYLEIKVLSSITGVICPNFNALDGYYSQNTPMRRVLDNAKIIEIPTGCKKITPIKSSSQVRAELGIGEDEFVVSYLGRYNHDKGYENFKNIVENTKHKNIKFISAGLGELDVCNNDNYMDLGWRTDAPDIINASDIVIVPNNVAYFDLIILECMSIGKRVITTYVGGSKQLVKGSVEYLYFDCEDTLSEQFDALISKGVKLDRNFIEEIFDREYSIEAFKNNLEEKLANE
ncbi:TPA: glycosyltransferase [Vibrio vulnificus]